MEVSEIFSSIQGESTLQGFPTVFIRLSGCNLDCIYCDTRYACETGTTMTMGDIIREVKGFSVQHVCITGGEPLLQNDTPGLVKELLDRGRIVSVETNGTIDASVLPLKSIRIIDIKCPGSGEHGKTFPENFITIKRRQTDEFKFVLTNRDDFVYACNFVKKHGLAPGNAVLFSPVQKLLDPALLAEWILGEMPIVRLHLQLHKYIWPAANRGR